MHVFFHTIKQLTQFWHYLPRNNIGSYNCSILQNCGTEGLHDSDLICDYNFRNHFAFPPSLHRPTFYPGISVTPEAAEGSSPDLSNVHKVWISERLKITSCPKLFQLLSPKKEWHPGYFSMNPDRGILKLTPELSSRTEGMTYYAYLTSHQSAPNMTMNL